jgi:NAD(P)-dependent dehydrogenase (short-subunit alcohol dehydrogenase family)
VPKLSLFELTGKSALVTGGAVGLGRAAAHALAMAGANVAIVDINEEVGIRTAASIRSEFGVRSVFVHCDISEGPEIERMTNDVVKALGRVDIAVNNAGLGLPEGNGENLAALEWERILRINLTGVFLCAQAQARYMISQLPPGGKIINVGSMYGLIAGGNVAYNTSKAGVIHLTRSLAAEWGRFNINVNCVSPSWVMTPGMIETPESVRAQIREVTPMGHVQRPQDIHGAIIYLASAASDFVTGHNLVVDGGHTLNTWFKPFTPYGRQVPPRVTPEEETAETMKDLKVLGGAGDHRDE